MSPLPAITLTVVSMGGLVLFVLGMAVMLIWALHLSSRP